MEAADDVLWGRCRDRAGQEKLGKVLVMVPGHRMQAETGTVQPGGRAR